MASHESQVTSRKSRVASHESQVTSRFSPVWCRVSPPCNNWGPCSVAILPPRLFRSESAMRVVLPETGDRGPGTGDRGPGTGDLLRPKIPKLFATSA